MKLGNRELRVALIVATGFIGCADGSAPHPYENVSEVSQAWGTAACSTAAPNATRSSAIVTPILSPQSYATCTKSYVVDLFGYAELSSGTGGGPPDAGGGISGTGGSAPDWGDPTLTVRWGDSLPTTKVECEDSYVGGIFYRNTAGSGSSAVWSEPTGQVIRNGVWSNGACQFPPVVYEPLSVGEDYRVAATARTSSNTTRKVSIRTGDPDVP